MIWIQDEATLIRDEAGTPLYWQGFLLDVTSKKEAQEDLGEVARAYRGLFDSVTDAIYIQDRTGRFLDVNLGAAKCTATRVSFSSVKPLKHSARRAKTIWMRFEGRRTRI